MSRPNVLFVMTDQQRFDTIAALGNTHVATPNLDRLVVRGVAFTRAYSPCPVCVPARYIIRTGRQSPRTGVFSNWVPEDIRGHVEDRCGPYLARTMSNLGYRTFGVGKFHTNPWNEDLGYDVKLPAEELYGDRERRAGDAYASFIDDEHPEFAHVEGLMGERSEMYYMPQTSPFPARLTSEDWVASRAIDQLGRDDGRPFFGMVSFKAPHPPLAPPVPYNRAYDPDRMPDPVLGDLATDHADEQIPWMNHGVWSENVDPTRARVLKARYYGEISYVDHCLGRILDAVEARDDADDTLICFYSDHGDHLGDHHGWQKESFFEESCRIPFLVSWPNHLAAGTRNDALVSLVDLFGLATGAAGALEQRDGIDILGLATGDAGGRDTLTGYYGEPGTPRFKMMVRQGPWKYIFLANGGREQLFHVEDDPQEIRQLAAERVDVTARLRDLARDIAAKDGLEDALDRDRPPELRLREYPYSERPRRRIIQFEGSLGIRGFPADPAEVLPSI